MLCPISLHLLRLPYLSLFWTWLKGFHYDAKHVRCIWRNATEGGHIHLIYENRSVGIRLRLLAQLTCLFCQSFWVNKNVSSTYILVNAISQTPTSLDGVQRGRPWSDFIGHLQHVTNQDSNTLEGRCSWATTHWSACARLGGAARASSVSSNSNKQEKFAC